ncbi:MAG: VCBS domain-containing protein, partial [Pseudomonadota bacterium]
ASGALAEGAEIIDAFGQLAATDADIGDVVTWSGESQAQFGTFQISPDGAWSYQLNNALADPLKAGQTVVERLQAVAQDLSGLRTFQTVEVLLTGTNDVPILRINSVFDTVEDTSVVAALSSFDLDGAPGELTYSAGADGPDDGVVSIVSDGTFTYTPNLGFAGFDRFEYVVQDAAGGVSSAFATIAVQSDPDAQDESQVSVTLNREASSDASAGSLGIDIQGTTVASVNLAFVLDSSGSIGRTAWAEMLSNVRTSVQNLSALFEGSDTSVDVQIIPFSARAEPTAVYDISDPALINVIDPSVLDFIGRGTSWTRAFQAAGDLFFNEPANEPNFLLFVTDGRPSDGAWVEPFGELTDTSDDYDVSISAFGFGPRFEPGTLSDVDANAVVLSGPNDLSEAFAATPVFNPELIGLTVELLADDSPSVVIADETSPALLVEESDFELPLASIENIVDMLGDENRVSITALFDLNGDTSSAEIRIFTSEVIGKAENAQNASGLAGDDLLFGSESSDTIMGAGGNDVILAFEGDDILTGGAGADKIRAGDGADRLILGELAESGDDFDGGAGRDTLVIDVAGDINALIAALDLSNTEVIDADNSLANSMTLTYEDVAGFSETDDTELQELLDAALPNAHSVLGDGDDSIVLDGAGTYSVQMTGSVVDGAGNTLELYTFSLSPGNALATLGIEADVDVSTTNTVVVS